jgi:Spy/CpxP family protein refolding chaperone
MSGIKDGYIMKNAPNALAKMMLLTMLVMIATVSLCAQTPQQTESQPQTPSAQSQQTTQADQMLGPLNLTQDQIQRIRMINAELRDERQAANFRLRTTQRALSEAIQSSTPDEVLIAQRSKEVADAQANTIRLRSLTEARILQVLTPEQRQKLRILRQQGAMRRGGGQQLPRVFNRRPNAIQRNQNPNGLTPKQQRRLMRQQQQRP